MRVYLALISFQAKTRAYKQAAFRFNKIYPCCFSRMAVNVREQTTRHYIFCSKADYLIKKKKWGPNGLLL